MFDVGDLEDQLNRRLPLPCPRIHLTDVRLEIGNRRDHPCQDPLPVVHEDVELHGKLRSSLIGPLDCDLPVGVEHQIPDVRAIGAVNRNPFATCDVSDDLFPWQRGAALGQVGHEVIVATNLDRLGAGEGEDSPHGLLDDTDLRLFLLVAGRSEPLEDRARGDLAVADVGVEVIQPGQTVLR